LDRRLFPAITRVVALVLAEGSVAAKRGAVVHAGSASNENDQDKIGETITV